MKRLIILLLIALLLVGCDLQNRRDSEDFIPTGTFAGATANEMGGGGDPWMPQEKSTVKTVLSYAGEVPMSEPTRAYSYQLPMIDLSGAHAAGCNRDIEDYYGSMIRSSMEAMERFEDPILERLSYSSYTISGILTLRMEQRDYDGTESQSWYTVDAETGEEVSVDRLFAAAGISGKPQTVLSEAVEKLFVKRFGATPASAADSPYSTARFQTLEALQPLKASRMHLNENGGLTVAFELFAPNGGSTVEELILP